jgi:multidrug efflux system membrane fusion protein
MPEENNPSPEHGRRKIIGKRIGLAIIVSAVLVALMAIWSHDHRPETDDATVRANFIGIAPHASGHITKLHVKDGQLVKEGELLFEIDPRPYEDAVASAKSGLVLARQGVDALNQGVVVADALIARADAQRVAAEASVERAEAEFADADDHLKRLEPLLKKEFVTADQIEKAHTTRHVAETEVTEAKKNLIAAEAAVAQAKAERLRAVSSVGQEGDFNARIAAAETQLEDAKLNLEYCRVLAPFTGKVVNLDISHGAFARTGVDVFTLVDTRTWYVVANFRETQLKHIQEGAPVEIYLQSKGGKRFGGKIVGLAWAVVPENGTSAAGLPNVPRNLDWVRLAQRFPVRIQVENPDNSFRIGESAVVMVTGSAPQAANTSEPQN